MFSVLFEVHPKKEHWDTYLGVAKMLRPEIERIDGFIDNIRYRSLTREGWIFSLSGWRDEKALVRWRTQSRHHDAQDRGRTEILSDYHLRVGQITHDTRLPEGQALRDQRLDETEAGGATMITLIDASHPADWVKQQGADGVAKSLGLDPQREGAGRLGRVRRRAVSGRRDPADVVAQQGGCGSICAQHRASIRRAASPGSRGPRLRHVRPPRSAAILSGREGCCDDPRLSCRFWPFFQRCAEIIAAHAFAASARPPKYSSTQLPITRLATAIMLANAKA